MQIRKSFFIVVNIMLILFMLGVSNVQRADATWHYLLYEEFSNPWGSWPWTIAGNQWNVLPYG